METYIESGKSRVLRGIIDDKIWSAKSVIVVEDNQNETVLLLMPGAQCMFPEGLLRRRQGDNSLSRWTEAKGKNWRLQEKSWQTNRFLMVLEPEKYYATFYIWEDESNDFICFYVNFQLPFQRSHCGFDTFDLALDIVVSPDYEWAWKDQEEYDIGVREQGIKAEWAAGIESAKPEVLDRIHQQRYPFDGSWLTWRPDPSWTPPRLPDGWDVV